MLSLSAFFRSEKPRSALAVGRIEASVKQQSFVSHEHFQGELRRLRGAISQAAAPWNSSPHGFARVRVPANPPVPVFGLFLFFFFAFPLFFKPGVCMTLEKWGDYPRLRGYDSPSFSGGHGDSKIFLVFGGWSPPSFSH